MSDVTPIKPDVVTANVTVLNRAFPDFQFKERVAAILRKRLEEIENGEICAIALVMVRNNGGIRTAWDMSHTPLAGLAMIGAITSLHTDMTNQIFGMRADPLPPNEDAPA